MRAYRNRLTNVGAGDIASNLAVLYFSPSPQAAETLNRILDVSGYVLRLAAELRDVR
jgi:hypothetical protein